MRYVTYMGSVLRITDAQFRKYLKEKASETMEASTDIFDYGKNLGSVTDVTDMSNEDAEISLKILDNAKRRRPTRR